LQRHASYVSLIIEDDGVGFHLQEVLGGKTDRAHLGLRGMQERILLCGGHLDIESLAGEGTTLFVRIPLADAIDLLPNTVEEDPQRS